MIASRVAFFEALAQKKVGQQAPGAAAPAPMPASHAAPPATQGLWSIPTAQASTASAAPDTSAPQLWSPQSKRRAASVPQDFKPSAASSRPSKPDTPLPIFPPGTAMWEKKRASTQPDADAATKGLWGRKTAKNGPTLEDELAEALGDDVFVETDKQRDDEGRDIFRGQAIFEAQASRESQFQTSVTSIIVPTASELGDLDDDHFGGIQVQTRDELLQGFEHPEEQERAGKDEDLQQVVAVSSSSSSEGVIIELSHIGAEAQEEEEDSFEHIPSPQQSYRDRLSRLTRMGQGRR